MSLALRVLVERYGMDGRGARSVAEVARRHRVTRSTIRLLEGEILAVLKELAR